MTSWRIFTSKYLLVGVSIRLGQPTNPWVSTQLTKHGDAASASMLDRTSNKVMRKVSFPRG